MGDHLIVSRQQLEQSKTLRELAAEVSAEEARAWNEEVLMGLNQNGWRVEIVDSDGVPVNGDIEPRLDAEGRALPSPALAAMMEQQITARLKRFADELRYSALAARMSGMTAFSPLAVVTVALDAVADAIDPGGTIDQALAAPAEPPMVQVVDWSRCDFARGPLFKPFPDCVPAAAAPAAPTEEELKRAPDGYTMQEWLDLKQRDPEKARWAWLESYGNHPGHVTLPVPAPAAALPEAAPLSVCCQAPTFRDGSRLVCEKCRTTRPL